ncbi:MAG: hypothetical protein JEZ09_19375, partial [Salinivirgaceae bacterium]|nr:hypothetical protein [Salinivirgaceae bacterium]
EVKRGSSVKTILKNASWACPEDYLLMKKLIIVLVLMQIVLISHSQCATAFKDWRWENSTYRHQLQLCVGEWTVTGAGDRWNDYISSIRVPAGLTVVVYEHEKYQGASMTLTSDWSVSGGSDPWNDRISSIRVSRTQLPPLPVIPPKKCQKPHEEMEFYHSQEDYNRAAKNFKTEAVSYCSTCGGLDWESTKKSIKASVDGSGNLKTIKFKGTIKCKGK